MFCCLFGYKVMSWPRFFSKPDHPRLRQPQPIADRSIINTDSSAQSYWGISDFFHIFKTKNMALIALFPCQCASLCVDLRPDFCVL